MKPKTFSLKNMSDHPLITGTLILTLTGLVSRLIGFFYRIYLSRIFGEENMGIYQLISPVISLTFALSAAAYQTAVSKLTAELAVRSSSARDPRIRRPFWAALTISLPLSFLCTAVTFLLAEPIGSVLLKEPRTVPLLRIIAFSFPFVGIHACINGWFYGMKKAGLPAIAQLVEQLTRVGYVYLITKKTLAAGQTPDISAAVFGLALGELVSMSVAIFTYLPFFQAEESSSAEDIASSLRSSRGTSFSDASSLRSSRGTSFPGASSLQNSRDASFPDASSRGKTAVSTGSGAGNCPPVSFGRTASPSRCGRNLRSGILSAAGVYRGILAMALPLTANRLTLNFLGSAESVAIPEMLRLYGYTTENALSVYGVLTGMAMPLIFFPNALTSSIAVMLLPMISEKHSLKKYDAVRSLTLQTLKYSFLMGFACMTVFSALGPWLGTFLFNSPLAGRCIRTLGFICPFLYLDTTLSSILQGLGKAGAIFFINITSLLVRLAFVYFAIPVYGIKGYLWGMLAGQIILCVLCLLCLLRYFRGHR